MAEVSQRTKGHRDAVHTVSRARGFTMTLPCVGRVRVPHPEQLAFYGALGVLAVVEIIDWPVALLVGVGHMLVQDDHNRIVQEIGEALEEA
ncbi:hypothetical protein V4U86_27815 [Mycobacterium sp. AMU20-3851]|uniref:hypothetical protein n=1 Tax=Mycobacterium sp. AMU20-3851 TaxID=3122055 RepID=UPI003754EC98